MYYMALKVHTAYTTHHTLIILRDVTSTVHYYQDVHTALTTHPFVTSRVQYTIKKDVHTAYTTHHTLIIPVWPHEYSTLLTTCTHSIHHTSLCDVTCTVHF